MDQRTARYFDVADEISVSALVVFPATGIIFVCPLISDPVTGYVSLKNGLRPISLSAR